MGSGLDPSRCALILPSQKYVAISGGVQILNADGDNVWTNDNNLNVADSFPGSMDWSTNTPKADRLDGWVVRFGALEQSGVLRKGADPIKILGNGELKVALTVRAHRFTASAAKKIEAAGGKAEAIEGAGA